MVDKVLLSTTSSFISLLLVTYALYTISKYKKKLYYASFAVTTTILATLFLNTLKYCTSLVVTPDFDITILSSILSFANKEFLLFFLLIILLKLVLLKIPLWKIFFSILIAQIISIVFFILYNRYIFGTVNFQNECLRKMIHISIPIVISIILLLSNYNPDIAIIIIIFMVYLIILTEILKEIPTKYVYNKVSRKYYINKFSTDIGALSWCISNAIVVALVPKLYPAIMLSFSIGDTLSSIYNYYYIEKRGKIEKNIFSTIMYAIPLFFMVSYLFPDKGILYLLITVICGIEYILKEKNGFIDNLLPIFFAFFLRFS